MRSTQAWAQSTIFVDCAMPRPHIASKLALDFAIQCAPDHPAARAPGLVRLAPRWFDPLRREPAEEVRDIVNVDFYAEGAVPSLWLCPARHRTVSGQAKGAPLPRRQSAHQAAAVWEWMIAEVTGSFPDAVFLAEAFTRPKLMYRLAKIGFSQSYTYFTWRNTKAELTEYMIELTTNAREFFVRILRQYARHQPVFLQTSGRPGFLIRAALAATLSGLFGVL